jgi:hypothetical protein
VLGRRQERNYVDADAMLSDADDAKAAYGDAAEEK